MAKKKTATTTSSAATKTRKSSAGKPASKPRSKKVPAKQHDEQEEEIILNDIESEAVDHIVSCDAAREALEQEVNKVVTQAVRKICKVHGKPLSDAQAQNVAMVLFGD